MIAHDFLLLAPQSRRCPESSVFFTLRANDLSRRIAGEVKSAGDVSQALTVLRWRHGNVPALANVRAFLSSAQEKIW
jgi:hypothetical protein